MTAGKRLWQPLLALARGVTTGTIRYGVLVVCPNSSRTIRRGLARDIVLIGEGQSDHLGSLAREFQCRLAKEGLSATRTAQALRIVTLHCVDGDTASIVTACTQLHRICSRATQAQSAWDRLYADANNLIERRGRRAAASIAGVLLSGGISLRTDRQTPAAIAAHLSQWAIGVNASFSVSGVDKALALQTAWILGYIAG